MPRLEFVSQRHTKYADYGCGVACLAMLLRYRECRTPSVAELGAKIKIDTDPGERLGPAFSGYGYGAFNRDIVRYLECEDHSYVHIEADPSSKAAKDTLIGLIAASPTMVGVGNESNPQKWGAGGHWIVVEHLGAERVRYLDPNEKANGKPRKSLKIEELLDDWDGVAVSIM